MKKIMFIVMVLLLSIVPSLSIPVRLASASGLLQGEQNLNLALEQCGLSTNYTTRELLDLAGNKYILVECKSGGYGIYHPTAQVFVEFSAENPSPYLGKQNIRYGGPMNYYCVEGNQYTNLLSGEQMDISATQLSQLTAKEEQLTCVYQSFSASSQSASARAANTTHMIPNAYYFQKMYYFGTCSNDAYTQMAASIMLSYYANYANVNFVPTNCIVPLAGTSTNFQTWGSMPELTSSLCQELVSITQYLGEDILIEKADVLEDVLTEYYSRHLITGIVQETLSSPYFVDSNMRDILEDNNPMVMIGKFTMPDGTKQNRAVVCYGYSIISNVTYYRVHMGYGTHTAVDLANQWTKNLFYQIYYIDYTGNHVHSRNFVVNGVSYCGCGTIYS